MPPLEREPQGHEPETRTPGPAPRRARHCSLRAGPVQGAGRRAPPQAVVERDAARAEPGGARRLSRGGGDSSSSIPTARQRALRDAIAATYGLNPDRIVCGAGSDEILYLLAHAYHRPRRRGHLHRARLPGLPDRHPRRGRHAGRGAGDGPRDRRRRDPGAGDGEDPGRLHRQSQQPDRHLHARSTRCGGCMPACRPTSSSCSTPPTAEYVRRNDYESGIELAATADNVVMTRTFSKIYGLAGLRIGWCYAPGARSSTRSTASAGRSTCPRRRSPPASPRSRDRGHVERAVAHNEHVAAEGGRGGDRSSG